MQGACTMCPSKCLNTEHRAEHIRYVSKSWKVYESDGFLQSKYKEAKGKQQSAQQFIKRCTERIEEVRKVTLVFVKKVRRCIKRIREIALKPNPLSSENYIELLIESEKKKGRDFVKERITSLMQLKLKVQEQAKLEYALQDENYNPMTDTDIQIFNFSTDMDICQQALQIQADFQNAQIEDSSAAAGESSPEALSNPVEDNSDPKVLKGSKEEVAEREALNVTIIGIHYRMGMTLAKLHQCQAEKLELESHHSNIEPSIIFTYQVCEQKVTESYKKHRETEFNMPY